MSRPNVVQSRKFSEMLQETVRAYENRTLESAQVILELIGPAKQMRDAGSEKTTSGSPKTTAIGFLAVLSLVATTWLSSPAWAGYSIDDVSKNEGNAGSTTFTFTVTLNSCPFPICSVNYTTVAGTAFSGDDFLFQSGTLMFEGNHPPEQTRSINITVSGDGTVEVDEQFTVALLVPTGPGIDDPTGFGTIANDDSAVVAFSDDSRTERDPPNNRNFSSQLSLSAPVDRDVVVDWSTVDGTAVHGGSNKDYTDAAGTATFDAMDTLSKTIVVSGKPDDTVELDETFSIQVESISAAGRDVTAAPDGTITIENDDSAQLSIHDLDVSEGETTAIVDIEITTDNPVDVSVSVACSTADGTATVTDGDFVQGCQFNTGSIFMLATSGLTRVTLNGDGKVELDEDFVVNLGAISSAGRDVSLADGQAVVTLLNDDSAVVRIFNKTALEGDSGPTDFDLAVKLDQGSVDTSIDVDFMTMDLTALVSDSDYTSTLGTVTLSGIANQVEYVTVEVNGDKTIEPDEEFKVVLSQLDAAGRDVSFFNTEGIGTILDDDSCMFNDQEGLSDTTITTVTTVHACLTVTVGPNVFVDAPNGDLMLVAGESIVVNHLEVQNGATVAFVVDRAAVLP